MKNEQIEKENAKIRNRFIERYLDTIVYVMTLLILAALVVAVVELQGEVRKMRNEIKSLREQVTVSAIIDEPKDDGHITGDDIPAQWPRLYTDEDAIALAKLTWGEARGVPDLKINGQVISARTQQAAVMWTVLNRFDEGYADSIIGVITAYTVDKNGKIHKQFHGYSEEYPVEEELLELAYDVLDRWNAEKHGETVVRELPAGYLWFHGDGTWNWFRDAYKNGNKWDWSV